MKKFRILALALALVLCFSMLGACSGDTNGSADGKATEGATADAENTDTGSGEPINLGVLAPLTGDVAQYGIAVNNGVKLYIKQVNAAGGVNGKQITLIPYDEEGDATNAITGYNSLVDQGVTAIIGSVTSTPTIAVVSEAFADNMPMITASATAAGVTYDEGSGTVYTNMFRSCFIDPFQGEKMATFAVEELGAQTAAVLYDTGDDYSLGVMEAFVETAKALGLEIVAREGYPNGSMEFQSQLTNIAAQNPDVLFAPVYYEDVALIAQQAASAGVTAPMMGVDGWDTVLSVIRDASLLEGAYYCSGYSAQDDSALVQSFLSDYEAEYGETPNMFAAQGYDAAMVLIAALEQAESQGLAAGSDAYKQAVIDAMAATDMTCVTGSITYDEYNNPQKTAFIINITGGSATLWGQF